MKQLVEKPGRSYQYDNMRFLLIVLVVFGHFIEIYRKGHVTPFYKTLYTFHMPAFLFLTGRFAKFDRKRILKNYLILYLIFQTLYLCFNAVVIRQKAIVLEYTTPHWILWYLLVTILYSILLPLLPEKGTKSAVLVWLGSILVALLVGFDETIGYTLSLSRFFVFAPYFLLGYYYDSLIGIMEARKQGNRLKRLLLILVCLVVIILGTRYILEHRVAIRTFFGAVNYTKAKSSVWNRLLAMVVAFAWILALDLVMPNRRLPVISLWGQNTMSIFLLHGFLLRLCRKYKIFHYSDVGNIWLAVGLTLAIVLVLGNPYLGKCFKKK